MFNANTVFVLYCFIYLIQLHTVNAQTTYRRYINKLKVYCQDSFYVTI